MSDDNFDSLECELRHKLELSAEIGINLVRENDELKEKLNQQIKVHSDLIQVYFKIIQIKN